MPSPASSSRPTETGPLVLRLLAALGFPFIAAITVAGTYFGKEVIVTAGWVAVGTVAFLFVRPTLGISVMTAAYMLAAYPTVLQSLGVFTINNLLGVAFVVLLGLRVIETRDLSFLKAPPVILLALIGIMFAISEYHSEIIFPLLQQSRGRALVLDRSDEMWHDFITRLAFLIFIIAFVRERSDVKTVYHVFFMALFVAIPSAVYNLATGQLVRGFRIQSSITGGTNPNRLAMIALTEIACWWCWAHARNTKLRWVIALGCIGASVITLLGTGSRSGLLGAAALGLTLQTGPRRFRLSVPQMAGLGVVAIVILITIIPPAAYERMINFSPEAGQIGASSNKLREDTVFTAINIAEDHPFLGIGLGNFREVSRQVYMDQFFRPPHNSFLWALTEGGICVLAGYGLLFWFMWLDLRRITELAHLDEDMVPIASAMRMIFLTLMFFSIFADLWLAPQTYVLAGLFFAMRRYLDSLVLSQRTGLALQRPAGRRDYPRAALAGAFPGRGR